MWKAGECSSSMHLEEANWRLWYHLGFQSIADVLRKKVSFRQSSVSRARILHSSSKEDECAIILFIPCHKTYNPQSEYRKVAIYSMELHVEFPDDFALR